MIHHAVVQGSEEWLRLRLGRPTASNMERIITPAAKITKDGEIKGWQPTEGKTRRRYQIELLTELILDCPLDAAVTPAMLHGKDWEPKARAAYEMSEGVDVEQCGFCTLDDGSVGASPDCFVGEEGLAQFKCPEKPEIHVGYLMDPKGFEESHWVQCQSELYVCPERKWNDLVSYFMGIPSVKVRITPHPEFQKRLHAALQTFLAEFKDLCELAVKRGVKFPDRNPKPAADYGRDWITDEDAEAILAAQRQGGL